MIKRSESVDNVRASRDGHEYHETWTARKALQLLLPDNNLYAIAVEGMSPVDQTSVSASAVEVADLTLYFGNHSSFSNAGIVRGSSLAQGKPKVRY